MTEDKKTAPDKNWLEWIVFGLSLLLVAGLLGYLTYRSFTHKATSPDLRTSAQLEPGDQNQNRYKVRIKNTGGQTAENIKVEVVLKSKGKKEEKAALEVAFSPMKSVREGWVVFDGKPAPSDSVTARVVSYKKP